MSYSSRREGKIRDRAYEISEFNRRHSIKATDMENWLEAERQIEEEDKRELERHIEHLKETWL